MDVKMAIIQVASVLVCWTIGMYAINKLFGIILKRKEQLHIRFMRSAARGLLTVIACIWISSFFTVTKALSTALLTSSSLLVAVVGFAAQQVLSDVISGLMLSWSKPFEVGDKINASSLDISGIVEDMTVRHTVVRTYHNSRMIIPNSIIDKAIVENINYNNANIGYFLEIGVSYESDIRRAVEVMRDTIAEHPLVIDVREDKEKGSKVNVMVKELAEDGYILKAAVWTKNLDDSYAACSDLRCLIKENFDKEDISIPYHHVHVVGM